MNKYISFTLAGVLFLSVGAPAYAYSDYGFVNGNPTIAWPLDGVSVSYKPFGVSCTVRKAADNKAYVEWSVAANDVNDAIPNIDPTKYATIYPEYKFADVSVFGTDISTTTAENRSFLVTYKKSGVKDISMLATDGITSEVAHCGSVIVQGSAPQTKKIVTTKEGTRLEF